MVLNRDRKFRLGKSNPNKNGCFPDKLGNFGQSKNSRKAFVRRQNLISFRMYRIFEIARMFPNRGDTAKNKSRKNYNTYLK